MASLFSMAVLVCLFIACYRCLRKKNSIVQLKLQLDKNLYDLKINNEIKGLRINGLKADLEDAKRLVTIGGGTANVVKQCTITPCVIGDSIALIGTQGEGFGTTGCNGEDASQGCLTQRKISRQF